MIHDELLMVRSFTVDSENISFTLHELLRHWIGAARIFLCLTAIRGLCGYVFMCICAQYWSTFDYFYWIFGGAVCLRCFRFSFFC